jgi:uncharacterized protein (DUF58 family)
VTPTCLVLDASASMGFPDGAAAKWSLVRQLAVALASVAHTGGDPIGLMICGHPSATLPPRTRRGVVAEVMRVVERVSANGSSSLAASVATAGRVSARIAIVSDFLGDLDDTLRVARELIASGRDVYALHVVAKEEIDPPAAISAVADPENAEVRRALSGDARAGYERAFREWRETTARCWLGSGAAYRMIITGAEPVSHSVRRIVRGASSSRT